MNTKSLLLVLAATAAVQAIDPFYLRSLKDGEAHFQARRFVQAAESLELAAFGLYAGKDQLARTRVLLALTYGRLDESAKAEQNLKSALGLLGLEGLRSYALPETDRADLDRLIKLFKVAEAAPPPPPAKDEPAPAPPKAATKPGPAGEATPKPEAAREDLAEAVRRDPRAAEPAYALAGRQVESGDPAAAKATLNRLLENNPAEIRARLEIGRIEYGERRLKDAEKSLEKFLALSGSLAIDRRLVLQGKSLLALSAYLRGETRKAKTALEGAAELSDPALRAGLGLSAEDQERLARLLTPPTDR